MFGVNAKILTKLLLEQWLNNQNLNRIPFKSINQRIFSAVICIHSHKSNDDETNLELSQKNVLVWK